MPSNKDYLRRWPQSLRRVGVRHVFGARSPLMFRYLLTGGAAWVVDGTVFVLTLSAFGVVLAQLFARIVGAAVAFFGHKLFVFREVGVQPSTLVSQSLRYVGLWFFSYTVSTLALVGLIDHVGMNAIAAKVMVESGIVGMNYLVMKSLIFRPLAAKGTGE